MLFNVRTLADQARESMAEERLTVDLSTLLGCWRWCWPVSDCTG
jgi:hypothetical protein